MSKADSDRGRFFIPLRVRDDSKFLNLLEKGDEKSKNEILKLKELPNERLEGSWRALWLGIRTFFGFKLSVVVLPRISTFGKPNANMKTFGKSNATEKCSRNPIFPSQRYICRPKTFGKPNANLKTFGKSNATVKLRLAAAKCAFPRLLLVCCCCCLFVYGKNQRPAPPVNIGKQFLVTRQNVKNKKNDA